MAPENTNKLGLTPGKLALVAGLTIVLLIVIALQLGSSDIGAPGSQTKPLARPKARGGRNVAAAPSDSATASALAKKSAWPILTREEVQQHNPFLVSVILAPTPSRPETESAADAAAADGETASQAEAEAAALERAELLKELRGDGVNLVVLSADGQVARIGNKQIRVGDILRGFRVVEIAADGIVLVEQKSE